MTLASMTSPPSLVSASQFHSLLAFPGTLQSQSQSQSSTSSFFHLTFSHHYLTTIPIQKPQRPHFL